MTLDEAKVHLEDVIESNGDLYSLSWFLSWQKEGANATLDGDFDAEDLLAIATYMIEMRKAPK